MKKYEKPGVYVEELNRSFVTTSSCNYTADESGDPAPFPVGGGVMLFLVSNSSCQLTPENMGIQICYHGFNPDDQNNVFGS